MPESEKPRSAALGDIFIAGSELGELVVSMRETAAWTVPGYMARLVDRANQKLQVLLHNAEFLTAEAPRGQHDCPDCKGQGAHWVPARGGGARRVVCATCEGSGALP